MIEKLFISSQHLSNMSIQLAKNIHKSNYKPDIIIGISRGGLTPSVFVHEYLQHKNINCLYGVISAKSYINNNRNTNTQIDISQNLLNILKISNKILIIDDILDTGLTFQHIVKFLSQHQINSNFINFATLYYKPQNNKTNIIPKFFINQTDKWIVFPHEFVGLNNEEIKKFK
tara:strand:- start:333 stop:851 length:519 start_codon:yes stop_codon:yes gene_type:complete